MVDRFERPKWVGWQASMVHQIKGAHVELSPELWSRPIPNVRSSIDPSIKLGEAAAAAGAASSSGDGPSAVVRARPLCLPHHSRFAYHPEMQADRVSSQNFVVPRIFSRLVANFWRFRMVCPALRSVAPVRSIKSETAGTYTHPSAHHSASLLQLAQTGTYEVGEVWVGFDGSVRSIV